MEAVKIIIVSWIISSAVFTAFIFLGNFLRKQTKASAIDLSELTVIIPFRNEEKRISKLLNSLQNQAQLPKEIIFVNDHSVDEGAKLIEKTLSDWKGNWRILTLDENNFGKKKAIFSAVEIANSAFCLTLDADLELSDDYFAHLPHPVEFSMICLPVFMQGKGFSGSLMEIEYGSFQLLQGAVSENDPLMASGANLLFKKDDYLKHNDLSTHSHKASGDDQFALAQFKQAKLNVRSSLFSQQAVYTDVPNSIAELFVQRLRWMGNNTGTKDFRAPFIASWIFVNNVLFLALIITLILSSSYLLAFSLYFYKVLLDFLTYTPWLSKYVRWRRVLLLPILTLVYPIYLLVLLGSFLLVKVKWKDRKVNNNNGKRS